VIKFCLNLLINSVSSLHIFNFMDVCVMFMLCIYIVMLCIYIV
jgi:hypothetical protein